MELYIIICFIVSAIAFWSYWVRVICKWGIAKSISDSFYYHQDRLLFYLFLFLTAFPLMIIGEHALSFFAGVAAIGVGTAPHFKGSKLEHDVHVVCSLALYVLGFVALVVFGVYLPVIIMIAFLLIASLTGMRNKTWWVETVGYVLIHIGFLAYKTM